MIIRILPYALLAFEAVFAYCLLRRSGAVNKKEYSLIAVLGIAAAFLVRAFCFPYVSQDYLIFLRYWIDDFRTAGGFAGLSENIGNYNIPYRVFLAAISGAEGNHLAFIKLFSVFFDIVLAFSAMNLVRIYTRTGNLLTCDAENPPCSDAKPLAAFLAVLLLPTVIADSSLWGQCDSIYVSLALLGLYLGLADRPWLSVVCVAASFAFKLQAVFVLPIFIVLWMKKKLHWYHFLAFPAVYLLMMLPAVIAGMPLNEALLLYTTQTGSIGAGYSYNAPSLLAVIDAGRTALASLNTETAVPIVSKCAIAAAALAIAAILLNSYVNRKRFSDREIILTAALLSLAVPYLLPHMHDRYFFTADILTLVLMISSAGFIPVFALAEGASLFCYLCYFRYVKTGILSPVYIGAFAEGAALLLLLIRYVKTFKELLE